MSCPTHACACNIDAAVTAARLWRTRRKYHRRLVRTRNAPAFTEFETPERILLRRQRLLSRHAGLRHSSRQSAAGQPPSCESSSPASAGGSNQPFEHVHDVALERVINRTRDFQFTAFLEQATYVAHAVCRITTQLGGGRESYGTGFLVTPHLVLTNHHVLPDRDTAAVSTADFGYQQDRWGNVAQPRRCPLDPARLFLNDQPLDFALVAVDDTHRDRNAPWVWCPMIKELGKIITLEHINIIQHPRGEVKQVVIRENRLLDAFEGKESVLHYEADTEPGSSGSPVFNDQWEVVALHHSGVPLTDEQGNILKKDGSRWSRGHDPDDIDWIANEGIRASKIVAAIAALSPTGEARDLVQEFLAAEPPDPTTPHGVRPTRAPTPPAALIAAAPAASPAPPSSVDPPPPRSGMEAADASLSLPPCASRTTAMRDERPPQPDAVLRLTIPLHISITVGAPGPGEPSAAQSLRVSAATAPAPQPGWGDTPAALEKIAPAPDYDSRPGYDPDFLGFEVPFPKLTVSTRRQAYAVPGRTGAKRYLLDYYHYSVIFNRERYLAFVAGVNYDPTAAHQHPRDKGGDRWFYDPRVTPENELQAGEELYARNALDRGHLVRRADAAWGATAREAKLANDDTFHFTNCSPQHEVTNQGKRGEAPPGLALWGELEEYVATQGRETAQRLSIFNGPVFRNNDRIYRDVKLPKQFWKVIVFTSSSGTPAAAAFKLTQTRLIAGLEEAFDFEDYRTVQLSIKQLEAETGLNFGKVAAWDTLEDESVQESFAPDTGVVVLGQLADIVLGA